MSDGKWSSAPKWVRDIVTFGTRKGQSEVPRRTDDRLDLEAGSAALGLEWDFWRSAAGGSDGHAEVDAKAFGIGASGGDRSRYGLSVSTAAGRAYLGGPDGRAGVPQPRIGSPSCPSLRGRQGGCRLSVRWQVPTEARDHARQGERTRKRCSLGAGEGCGTGAARGASNAREKVRSLCSGRREIKAAGAGTKRRQGVLTRLKRSPQLRAA